MGAPRSHDLGADTVAGLHGGDSGQIESFEPKCQKCEWFVQGYTQNRSFKTKCLYFFV